MLQRLKDYIHETKKRKSIYVLSIFLALTSITALTSLIPVIRQVSVTGSIIPVGLQITSYILFALHIALCIFCRINHLSDTLRGIFFYQLPPVIFFIIELGLRIGESSSKNGAALKLFDLWTVYSRPISYLITPFVGMGEIYTKLISHIFLIMITYLSYSGIKKSIAFQEKLREKREFEEMSKKR